MYKKNIISIMYFGCMLPIGFAFAQSGDSFVVEGIIKKFISVIIDPIIILFFVLALLLFFYGLFQMIVELSSGGEASDGKRHMLWGIIGMTVMFSVGGIISLINNSIGVSDSDSKIQISGGLGR